MNIRTQGQCRDIETATKPRLARAAVRPPRRLAMVALVAGVLVLVGLVLVRSAPTALTTVTPITAVAPRPPAVLVASIDGLVDPAVAAYVHRAVAAAADGHAGALVIVLNASGGLDGPLQQVAQDLETSAVPTLAFIAPGRTEAADSQLARSSGLAAPLNTPDLAAFLRAADGTPVDTPAGPLTLATAGAPIQSVEMAPFEALAHRLMDPTTAYLLFIVGLFAALVELAHPGGLLPGAAGLVCLTLASVAFAMLPTNWFGVAVLVAAVGLMALELKAATHGALVLAGVGGLVLGSILLYSQPGSLAPMQAEISVAPGVLLGAAAAGLIGGLLLARIARRLHDLPPLLSLDQLIGARGVTRGGLDPDGVVHVGGQLWSARVRGGRLDPDQPIRVIARHGLVLDVEPAALGAATRKGTLS
jgi:membrane-bound ClpP family serine protease